MLEFTAINYRDLSEDKSTEIYSLRKKVFKDRLNWEVNCKNNMEFDAYDNEHTTYIMGVCNEQVVCSLRLIETRYPTMIIGTFLPFFEKIDLPEGNFIEASRFFVDKNKIKAFELIRQPVTSMLYLAVINYCLSMRYKGIYAIVSHAMYTIIKRSGWEISIIEQGISEKCQRVYLIHLPVDCKNQHVLFDGIHGKSQMDTFDFTGWPLAFASQRDRLDKL